MGLRKIIMATSNYDPSRHWHHDIELRRALEEHCRLHQNPIVQELANTLNVERYEMQPVGEAGDEMVVTRIITKQKKKKKKPRRMIQI